MNYKELLDLSYKNHLLFYDGECLLCNGFVQWLISKDKKAQILFVPLQQSLGLVLRAKLNMTKEIRTVIMLSRGKLYYKSDVSFEIARLLGFPYNISRVFLIIPRLVRDLIYDWVAANRYHWFGKVDSCIIPSAEIRQRFLMD